MITDNVKQMFGKIEKDAHLQKKYVELMQAHQSETQKELADKLVEFGKTSGFVFSKDELLAARAELIDRLNENKDLTDADLVRVAGGAAGSAKDFAIIASMGTVGLFCAIMSVNQELKGHGDCAEYLSATGSPKCTDRGNR
ncbi:MAG TPA: hypothetical protein PKK26_17235 [Candidatus Wallbacteria bacterium]|nr:hypothetical protein [Candidatus Wallbacteria bacterium]